MEHVLTMANLKLKLSSFMPRPREYQTQILAQLYVSAVQLFLFHDGKLGEIKTQARGGLVAIQHELFCFCMTTFVEFD